MINTAEIISGHYEGSSNVLVACNEASDVNDIVIYKFVDGVGILVGTGTLGNGGTAGQCNVSISEVIVAGNILVAYLNEIGNQGGSPVIVYENTTYTKTGWRVPQTVNVDGEEISYTDYLDLGGKAIADIYAPELTINNTVPRSGNGIDGFIDAYVEIAYTTQEIESEVVNVCVVTVKGFNEAIGSPRIEWDEGESEQVYQKTYVFADNGVHSLIIFPELENLKTKEITFTVNVASDTPTATITDIWSASYGINPEASRTVFLSAYSSRQLESRLLIVGTESFTLMTSNSGSRWEQNPYSYNVPTGTHVGEIRVQGTTDVLTIDVRVTF